MVDGVRWILLVKGRRKLFGGRGGTWRGLRSRGIFGSEDLGGRRESGRSDLASMIAEAVSGTGEVVIGRDGMIRLEVRIPRVDR